MKRGTKGIVFFASMALTVGSLIAIVGPRHHGYDGHCWQNEKQEHKEWGDCNKNNSAPSDTKDQSTNQ